MQEEVEQKSLTLTVNAAKMTARLFRAAIAKYVAHKKEKKHDAQTGVRYVGRQSVKKLVGQNQGVSNVELSGEDIKAFERVARKIRRGLCGEEGERRFAQVPDFLQGAGCGRTQCGTVRIHRSENVRQRTFQAAGETARAD